MAERTGITGMPVVKVKPDTLDVENRRFIQNPLKQPLFLNSIPKSGSHLLRNVIRMFVPFEQQYKAQFIQWANLQQHLVAFDREKNYLSWGHLFFSDASAIELAQVRKVLLVRDPYDWVLARARFFLSEQFSGAVDHIKEGKLSLDDLLTLMIFGIYQKAPPLSDIYMHNAVAWLGSGAHVVRYEELVRHCKTLESDETSRYFERLFRACGIDPIPQDWRERVLIGSDRKQSGTARENLTGLAVEVPDKLPDVHQRLVDVAIPGVRSLLGYS
jgi:hypothetical protein